MATKKNTDAVVERHEQELARARQSLDAAKVRRDRVASAVIDVSGRVRHSAAAEVAQRDVEIAALERRVVERTASLEHALADAPRRERAATMAADLSEEVSVLEQEKAERLADLVKLDADIARRRAKSAEHARLAAHTASELEARAAQEQASQDRAARELAMVRRASELTEASRVREVA